MSALSCVRKKYYSSTNIIFCSRFSHNTFSFTTHFWSIWLSGPQKLTSETYAITSRSSTKTSTTEWKPIWIKNSRYINHRRISFTKIIQSQLIVRVCHSVSSFIFLKEPFNPHCGCHNILIKFFFFSALIFWILFNRNWTTSTIPVWSQWMQRILNATDPKIVFSTCFRVSPPKTPHNLNQELTLYFKTFPKRQSELFLKKQI